MQIIKYGEVSIQIANYTEEELITIQKYTVDKAVHICNELQAKTTTTPVQPTVSTNVQQFPKKTPTYRTDSNYQQPQAPVQQQSTQPQQSNVIMIEGFAYKHCVNKQTGERFLALVNPDDLNRGAKKYVKE